jgi:hypothetical protein
MYVEPLATANDPFVDLSAQSRFDVCFADDDLTSTPPTSRSRVSLRFLEHIAVTTLTFDDIEFIAYCIPSRVPSQDARATAASSEHS